MKFTFKKQPRQTGLAGVGYPYSPTDIKYNKKVVGHISGPSYLQDKWVIHLALKKKQPDDNPNIDWKWVTVKTKFDEEPQAREWLQNKVEALVEMGLHSFEE